MALTWRGEQVKRHVREAARLGVQSTLEDAVQRARKRHPGWKTRTGRLEASIQIFSIRETFRGGIVGIWGSDEVYARYQEFGTARMPPNPFLRPSARTSYKRLKFRIKHHFRRLAIGQ